MENVDKLRFFNSEHTIPKLFFGLFLCLEDSTRKMTKLPRNRHISMAKYQLFFEPDLENDNIFILLSLLDLTASLSSIDSNFPSMHICMYVEFLEREHFFLMGEMILWWVKLKALLKAAAS